MARVIADHPEFPRDEINRRARVLLDVDLDLPFGIGPPIGVVHLEEPEQHNR